MRKLLLIIVIMTSISSCKNDSCDNIEEWVSDAPAVLEEYLEVKEEVVTNQAFVDEFSRQGSLFLSMRDTNKYFKYSMPKLREWFANGRGYISIEGDNESACYREGIDSSKGTVSGYIYHGKRTGQYKSTVVIIDSLSLKDGWVAHVVSCKGCNS